jgi:hypothetical protein
MTWIGGLFSKVNMSQSALRKKLALMMETACPANEPSAVAYPPCIRFILDDMHGQALVKISLPVEGTPPEHVHTDEKMGSSARYGYRYTGKKLWQVPQHVQLFLHALAYRKGLLDKSLRDRVGYFVGKARLSSRVLV